MNTPATFTDLIRAWGIQPLADDLGLKYVTVSAMKQRGNIAVRYWPKLLELAPLRGFALTASDLVSMAAAGKVAA